MKSKNYLIYIYILLTICLVLFFAHKKSGFYIDEYYTYTLTNGTGLGISIDENSLNSTTKFINQLVYQHNDSINFAQIYENNKNDVHPFAYYFIFRIFSLLSPGIFTKWVGIIINIIFLVPSIMLVYKISCLLSPKDKIIPYITLSFYCFSTSTISNVLLIRMYMMLSFWVMLYLYIILQNLSQKGLSQKFLASIFSVCSLGLLTQYYFVVAMFFISLFYFIYLLVFCHRIKDTVIFTITNILSLSFSFIIWPVAKFHIFKGYRGKSAINNFAMPSNTLERFEFFFSLINKYLFSGFIYLFLLLLIVFIFITISHRKQYCLNFYATDKCTLQQTWGTIAISFVCLGYFVVIAKIALLASYASNRYMYPIYGLLIILACNLLFNVINCIKKIEQTYKYILGIIIIAIIIFTGYLQKNVLFTYEDEANITSLIKENPTYPIISIQNETSACDLRINDWLLRDKIYFYDLDGISNISDSELLNSNNLIIYEYQDIDPSVCEKEIIKKFSNITKITLKFDTNSKYKIYLAE